MHVLDRQDACVQGPGGTGPQAWTPEEVLDCRGLLCPLPLLKTQQAVARLRSGQVLEVLTTDPQAEADLRRWAEASGHEVFPLPPEGGVRRLYVRRAGR